MRKSLMQRLVVATALPALLLAVSGCGGRGLGVQTFPSNADLRMASEPKPKPTVQIVTDPQAAERYNVEIESWGDRTQAAGVRICEWAVQMGAPLPFKCRREPPH